MKIKISVGITIILLLSTNLITISSFGSDTAEGENEIIEVKVAILSETPTGWDAQAPYCFVPMLKNYQWTVGSKTYKFIITHIFDKDVLNGELNTNDFDMLLCPGGGVGDGEALVKGFLPNLRPRVIKWKNNIADFIKNGGGYSGYCGGTALICDLEKKPETVLENRYEKSAFDVSSVKIYYEDVADFMSCQFRKDGWKRMGAAMYLCCHFRENESFLTYPSGGVCFDIPIMNNHPIFDDFLEETCRIRWVGGPGLIVPDDPSKDVAVLALYPEEEVSENTSTQLHYWRYTSGFLGLIKGIKNAAKLCIQYGKPLSNIPYITTYLISDWDPSDTLVELNYSNKPSITAEIYPNENKGRIVLTSHHPEFLVWWGGHIEELPDTNENCMEEGFFKWVDYKPFDETLENEITHTWWMVRRQVAWAAKVPDEDLPPVYGPSQVCDFEENMTSSEFTVFGNSETADGIVSLDLYYHFSDDQVNWTDWMLYDTDSDVSDGWSWEFNSLNGTGYYEFYSIRNVEFEGYSESEKVPPGPDAKVYVEIG